MYRVSQSTSGIEIDSHTMVSLEAVWHHVGSLISAEEGGLISDAMFETARLASSFAPVGDKSKSGGAGDAVELRDDRDVFLVGDASVAGKSPWGCERVDTIFR